MKGYQTSKADTIDPRRLTFILRSTKLVVPISNLANNVLILLGSFSIDTNERVQKQIHHPK